MHQMSIGTLTTLLCLHLLFLTVAAQPCTRDTYTSLPPLPSFPSTAYPGAVAPANQYTTNHWSQVAKMLRPTNQIVSTQTNCPHLAANLVDWHNASIWGGSVPGNLSNPTIPPNTSVLISSCSINKSFVFGLVTVPVGSSLIFGDAAITFQAHGMNVLGTLSIGSPTCRLRNKITITLYGSRSAQTLPAATTVKGISVQGSIDVHGVEYFPTWTRLAITANAGDTVIFIQDCPNWQPNQTIVITTTELKDTRDWHRNEKAVVQKVYTTTISSTVCAVNLTAPLQYYHYGGSEYQAEVALLSRNIVIQGDALNSEPTDTSPVACTYGTSPSTYPCDNKFMTGFGAHVIVIGSANAGRFSGLEMFRVGQTNQLARYPLHFHLLGNITSPNRFFISDCSVHRSYFRCYTIHGSYASDTANGITITKSTGYDVIGHCFFASEDGNEENHKITFNFAAFVHPIGPFWQTSYGITNNSIYNVSQNSNGAQSFYSQYTDLIMSTANLIRPDDVASAPFYITNGYNIIEGNAASGGWTGFGFPNFPAIVGPSSTNKKVSPKNRPLLSFKGNSAHSTGYWQSHAAGVYLGGNLVSTSAGESFTAGRHLPARDSCQDPIYGSPNNTNSCPSDKRIWLQFFDTKVFLSNVGLQSWGDRSEIIRLEVHDVQLSTNVFGQVWIDQMFVNSRSRNNITKYQGCNTTQWWTCNPRDYTFWNNGEHGFEFYDTAQSHILTNCIFQNCKNSIWSYLTHSDQFTPGLMQATKNISYNQVNMSRIMEPSTKPPPNTVSGRAANWLDEDGTVIPLFPVGTKVNIGSNWAGSEWWRYNNQCVNTQWNWICPMKPGDDRVSLILHWASSAMESGIGPTYCRNGAPYLPCPIGAYITHFNRNETDPYLVALMARVTGPLIASSGGWFIRFPNGTPNVVKFTDMQIEHDTVLHVAIPYPAGTTFDIYAQAPTWCVPPGPPYQSWHPICRHAFRPVASINLVRSSWGDTYFYDSSTQLLHIRIISLDSYSYSFGTNGTFNDNAVWNATSTWNTYFSRGGVKLLVTGSPWLSVVINATSANCQPRCPPMPNVKVPGYNGSSSYGPPPPGAKRVAIDY